MPTAITPASIASFLRAEISAGDPLHIAGFCHYAGPTPPPVESDIWYDTATGQPAWKTYVGGAWTPLAGAPSGGDGDLEAILNLTANGAVWDPAGNGGVVMPTTMSKDAFVNAFAPILAEFAQVPSTNAAYPSIQALMYILNNASTIDMASATYAAAMQIAEQIPNPATGANWTAAQINALATQAGSPVECQFGIGAYLSHTQIASALGRTG